MSFLYPIGLLGLIGVPVLIIIYVIKNKYTEQTVASTYLWTLSERFLKRKNPISRLTGIISLILQILAVTAISFAIAHPVFTLKGRANEYCFILDASGSMNIESGETTRFERAKGKIREIIAKSADGSCYSLIYMGDTTRTVYEKLTDKEEALTLLEETRVFDTEIDEETAIGIAQGYFNGNPSILTYLATDVRYEAQACANVNLLYVGETAENCAIKGVNYSFSGDQLKATGYVQSYATDTSDKTVALELYVDDFTTPKTTENLLINAADAEGTYFDLTCRANSFSKLKVAIREKDALVADNETIIFNTKSETTYKTLLVSDTPFFFESAVRAVSNASVDVISPEKYENGSGYGLYIFENFAPAQLPKDGTVWLINPRSQVENAGFTVQNPEVAAGKGAVLEISPSSSSTVQKLKKNLLGNDIYIAKYVKCGLYRNFTTLYTYKGNPIVFTGSTPYGNREVVFAFGLQDSNLTLLPDFSLLTQNLLEYSFPEFLEKVSYYAGEEVEVNVTSNCESVKIETPGGNVSYLATDNPVARYKLTETGVYKLTINVAGTPREFNVYAAVPEAERVTTPLAQRNFALQGDAKSDGYDGIYDDLLILFIFLALVFAADWVVYCYEKYQLR